MSYMSITLYESYKDSYAANRGLLGGKQRNKNRAQGEMPQKTGVQGEEGDGQEEAREGLDGLVAL